MLWIDEIEKGFSGSKSSGSTDGGTSSRVFGSHTQKPLCGIVTSHAVPNHDVFYDAAGLRRTRHGGGVMASCVLVRWPHLRWSCADPCCDWLPQVTTP